MKFLELLIRILKTYTSRKTSQSPLSPSLTYIEELEVEAQKEPHMQTPPEANNIVLVMRVGDMNDAVEGYQKDLEKLGYALPRFGADGSLGEETLIATKDFQDDQGSEFNALALEGVDRTTYAHVQQLSVQRVVDIPKVDIIDIRDQHSGDKLKYKRKKGWKSITGITLHQTACDMGEKPRTYRNMAAHIGITVSGKVVLVNPLNWVVYHGNGLNKSTVGVEINGHFAGVEEKNPETGVLEPNMRTYWRPKRKPDRLPMSVSEAQVQATLKTIKWIMDEVEKNGGKVLYIHAHRQSSPMKTSDPGSKVWQLIAMEAKRLWGLDDGGPDFKIGKGHPIPKEWDSSYTAKYR